MSFESLMTNCQSLKSSMEALAAIGAELRLRREKLSGDSRVRPLLQEVIHHIDPKLLDELDANQEEAALALIQSAEVRGPRGRENLHSGVASRSLYFLGYRRHSSGAHLPSTCARRLAHIRAQSTSAKCAGQSTYEFADRTRGWSSVDDKGGGGTPRRVRLRAGRGILTLAFHCVRARSAADPTQTFFGMKKYL